MEEYLPTREEELEQRVEILETLLEDEKVANQRNMQRIMLLTESLKQSRLPDIMNVGRSSFNDKELQELNDLLTRGRHLTMLETAAKENDLVQDAWKRLMLCLRLYNDGLPGNDHA